MGEITLREKLVNLQHDINEAIQENGDIFARCGEFVHIYDMSLILNTDECCDTTLLVFLSEDGEAFSDIIVKHEVREHIISVCYQYVQNIISLEPIKIVVKFCDEAEFYNLEFL